MIMAPTSSAVAEAVRRQEGQINHSLYNMQEEPTLHTTGREFAADQLPLNGEKAESTEKKDDHAERDE